MNSKIDFISPLTKIPGLSERRRIALGKSGIFTAGDLISHLPISYIDVSNIKPISTYYLQKEPFAICGIINSLKFPKNDSIIEIEISDSSGTITIPLNSIDYNTRELKSGSTVKVAVPIANKHELVTISSEAFSECHYFPRYGLNKQMKSSGITQHFLSNTIFKLLHSSGSFPERLPKMIENRYNFTSLHTALSAIHFPKSFDNHRHLRYRIYYEKLYQTAIALRWSKKNYSLPGIANTNGQKNIAFDFSLSDEQCLVIDKLQRISESPERMHHLLYSEPGNGKSVIAFSTLCCVTSSGGQCAWICRNERSANLQFTKIAAWVKEQNFSLKLLTNSTQQSERRQIVRSLNTGELQCIVTTDNQFDTISGFSSLRMIILDRPDHYSPQYRLKYQRKGISADLLILRDHKLTDIELQIQCSDLIPLYMSNSDLPYCKPRVRNIGLNNYEKMIHFLTEQLKNGESVLWIIPDIIPYTKQIATVTNCEFSLNKLQEILPENGEIIVVPHFLQSEELEEISQKLEQHHPKIIICHSEQDLPQDFPLIQFVVIENSDQISSQEIEIIRREIVIAKDSSWIFCTTNRKEPEHQPDIQTLELFKQINDDITAILTPE